MKAEDFYQLVVEQVAPGKGATSFSGNEILVAAVGGLTGIALAQKLRKRRIEAREREGFGSETGDWVRVQDKDGYVVFERRWDSLNTAMLLYDKMLADLLAMDVEQFRETYELSDREPPESPTDPWDGVTWSDDGAT